MMNGREIGGLQRGAKGKNVVGLTELCESPLAGECLHS